VYRKERIIVGIGRGQQIGRDFEALEGVAFTLYDASVTTGAWLIGVTSTVRIALSRWSLTAAGSCDVRAPALDR